MKAFYGGAIQGNWDRSVRRHVHQSLIDEIKGAGYSIASEHAKGSDFDETAGLLGETLGELPAKGPERTIFVRDKMIEFIESDISAAIFEVSVPSLGTGIEIAHAYLRPRLGLAEIPLLALYEKGFWPNKLSSMVGGLSQEQYPNFHLREYASLDEAKEILKEFLAGL
jgi:hypothetical protein